METDELLAIGRFARLTGLSIGALRHYDAEGLLQPARVDPDTGYRSYRRDQAADARLIARLRDLGLALPDVREVIGADGDERRRLLAAHRSRLRTDLARVQHAIHQLNRIVDHEDPIMTTPTPAATELSPQDHRQLGVDLFNHVWTLIETRDRTPEQIDEMIHAAHASRHHWSLASGADARNLNRGEWQCSRVYAVLGRSEPALWHARRGLEICEANGIGDWDLAFAYEALARAHRVGGDSGEAERFLDLARDAGTHIAEADDRQLLESDLATI